MVNKRIENGVAILEQYTEQRQIEAINTLFSSLPIKGDIREIKPFMNIIFQSYNEIDIDRKKELEYCIIANLDNPYVKYIHDFGYQPNKYLPNTITQHYKYISSLHLPLDDKNKNIDITTWLTYKTAFEYSNLPKNITTYGSYWGIINCDIFLDKHSQWALMRGRLNNGFVFAQSRHEFNILQIRDNNDNNDNNYNNNNDNNDNNDNNNNNNNNNNIIAKMDENFAKLYHANTQDGWFYKTPIQIGSDSNVDFHLGMLGCDNAIADRLIKSGLQVINQPETFKIMHYDIAKGKNSSNYLEKHTIETKNKNINNIKPKNKHPEQYGSYLIPNYDKLLGNNDDIDLNSVINSMCGMGGLSNQEKYKIIAEMYSSRLIINNPE